MEETNTCRTNISSTSVSSSMFELLDHDVLLIICGELLELGKDRKRDAKENWIVATNRSELFNFSHVSSHCRSIALPVLWSHVEILNNAQGAYSKRLVSLLSDPHTSVHRHIRFLSVGYSRGRNFGTEKWTAVFKNLTGLIQLNWKNNAPIPARVLNHLEERMPTTAIYYHLKTSRGRNMDKVLALLQPSLHITKFSAAVYCRLPVCERSDNEISIRTDFVGICKFLQDSPSVEHVSLSLVDSDTWGLTKVPFGPKKFVKDLSSLLKQDDQTQQITALTKLSCLDEDRISSPGTALITNMILNSITTWSCVKRVELINMSHELPYNQLCGRCPNLRALALTIPVAASTATQPPAFSFIQSLTSLRSLNIEIRTANSISYADLYDAISCHNSCLEVLHVRSKPLILDRNIEHIPCCFEIDNMAEITAWPALKDLSLNVPVRVVDWLNTKRRYSHHDEYADSEAMEARFAPLLDLGKVSMVDLRVDFVKMYQHITALRIDEAIELFGHWNESDEVDIARRSIADEAEHIACTLWEMMHALELCKLVRLRIICALRYADAFVLDGDPCPDTIIATICWKDSSRTGSPWRTREMGDGRSYCVRSTR